MRTAVTLTSLQGLDGTHKLAGTRVAKGMDAVRHKLQNDHCRYSLHWSFCIAKGLTAPWFLTG